MAYGAVVSLKNTIDNLLRSPKSNSVLPDSENELISKEICYLQSFIETIRPLPSSKRVDVSYSERRVKAAAEKFEDLISDRFHIRSDRSSVNEGLAQQQLLKVREAITSFTQTLLNTDEDHYQQPSDDSFDHDHFPLTIEKKYLGKKLHEELRDWIFAPTIQLRMMLIGGMAGIGKTALAREVCYDPDVLTSFECYSFVSIGPQYQLKQTVKLILRRMSFYGRKVDEIFLVNDDEALLVEILFQSLLRSKYLIVLDNVWNPQVWYRLRLGFPDNKNGSRIILTSRLLDFDRGDRVKFMEMPLLNDDESWNLLRKLVFNAQERCSPQLEKVGKKIAKNCEGLPLAIIEVGKLLGNIDRTVESWTLVAENEDPLTITTNDNTPLSDALSLSYRMLPQYLKVCFLYMGVFPKSYEIHLSKLVKLWVSEGFLQPEENQSLEKTAEECLNRLVSQSVVLNNKLSFIGTRKTKTCRLHFTFRNLCVNEANSEKFFYVIRKYTGSFPEDLNSQNRLCFHNNVVLGFRMVHTWMDSIPNARSLLCFGPKQRYPVVLYTGFRLLKVLDAVAIRFYEFPDQILDLVHLRYLAITYDAKLPCSIASLWNLEVLIVSQHHNIKWSNFPVYLPIEIWKLHKLKHLACMGFDLPDPSSANDDSLVLTKLLTLSGVSAHSCTVGVLARIPNLMKIGIKIESAHNSVETFSFLGADRFASLFKEFESFKCVLESPSLVRFSQVVSSMPINFPVNVKKITLSGCGFSWEYMRVIAELPNLEALKLRWYAFCGPVWETYKGGFRKLKFLLLEDLDLEYLISGYSHYPVLERLIVSHCYKLQKIPPEFGYHGSLEMIEVHYCTEFLMEEIKEEKEIFDNKRLQLLVHSSGDDDKKPKFKS
ncbi:hypothetical protein ABFX02_09G021600 [Erythranthe guttata]